MFPSFNPGIISVTNSSTDQVPRVKTVSTNSQTDSNRFGKFFDGLVPFTRFWGLLTAIVLAGVGVDLTFHRHRTGNYLIGGAAFILLAETTWVVTVFLRLCVRSDHKVWKSWCAVTWFSGWKKSLVYGPVGAIPIIWPHKLWLSYVSGAQLIFLALLHAIISLKGRKKKRRKSRLHLTENDSFDSSKFEEVTECLDDGLPEPIPGSSHSISDSLVEQDTVLEI